jgi:uncharacterized membrane protein (DUF485 family)
MPDLKIRIGLMTLALLASIPIGVYSGYLVLQTITVPTGCPACQFSFYFRTPTFFSSQLIVYELLWLVVFVFSIAISYLYKNKWQKRKLDSEFVVRIGLMALGVVIGLILGFGYEFSFALASLRGVALAVEVPLYSYIIAVVLFLMGILIAYKYKSRQQKEFEKGKQYT